MHLMLHYMPGTLIAIAIVFFKDWINLLIAGIDNLKGKKTKTGNMFWYLVAATIPGAGIGFILDHLFEEKLSTMYLLIGVSLFLMGIILYFVDKNAPKKTSYKDMTFKQTFLIGLSQCLAFIPGVSRSGVTTTVGRALGVKREAVAKYTFLLSTPIVFGATIYKIKDFGAIPLSSLLVGIIVSAIVGLFVIKFLFNYLKKGSYKVFAGYRVIVGILIIALALYRG